MTMTAAVPKPDLTSFNASKSILSAKNKITFYMKEITKQCRKCALATEGRKILQE